MFLFRGMRNRKIGKNPVGHRSLAAITIQHAWFASCRYRRLRGAECDAVMRGLRLSIYKLLDTEPSSSNVARLVQKYRGLHQLREYKKHYWRSI